MSALAAADPSPLLRFELRDALESDREYILDSWRKSWRNRVGRDARIYDAVFGRVVREGLLQQPDTRITVACAEYNTHRIWGWCCWTPGLVPTVHYALVRPADPWREDEPVQPLRGNGILWALLAAAGVTSELVYTMTPRTSEGLEAALLAAAGRHGITAIHRDVERDFLRLRR